MKSCLVNLCLAYLVMIYIYIYIYINIYFWTFQSNYINTTHMILYNRLPFTQSKYKYLL